MDTLFNDLFTWAQDVIARLGYPGITFLIALETFFPLMPTELILPLAGYLSAQGRLEWWAVEIAATLGSLIGASSLYALARWGGEPLVARVLDRYGRYFGFSSADLGGVQRWFDRNGEKMVVIARITPGLRTLISVPAGLGRMPLARFWLYTALGSGLWNGGLILAGRLLGDNWRQVEGILSPIGPIIYLLMIAAVVIIVARRLWQKRQAEAKQKQDGGDPS
jgi:membrane protein DedA with SNARE-associated domain